MLIIILLTILLAYWIIVQNKKCREFNAKLKDIPGTNSTYPILGDVHVWFNTKWSIHEKLKDFIDVLRDYPTSLKIWFGPKLVVVVNNPDDIKTVLTSPHCTDKSSIYHLTIGGEGIIVASGNKWRNQRRNFNPTFSIAKLNSYSNEFNQFGRHIVEALKEYAVSGSEFEITTTIGIHATDLILRTIYGSTQHKLELTKHCYNLIECLMRSWGDRLFDSYFYVLLTIIQRLFGISSEDKKLIKELQVTIQSIIVPRIKEYQDTFESNEGTVTSTISVKKENFVDKLIRLRFQSLINQREYQHTGMALLLAGTETTPRSITLILMMLAIHQEYQQKIYQEICKFFDVYGFDDIDISKLSELNLLERFIKETFRLFPIAPFFGRTPSQDIPIKEGVIPAGTDILISVVNIHKNPDVWGKDAKTFNPDNFLPEAELNRSKCSYLPFSYGPRNCIGYKFAQISTTIAIVYLLKAYRFTTKLKVEDIKIGYGLTSFLINANLISVQERSFSHK